MEKAIKHKENIFISWFTADLKKVISVSLEPRDWGSTKRRKLIIKEVEKRLDRSVNGIHSTPFQVLQVNWTEKRIKHVLFMI